MSQPIAINAEKCVGCRLCEVVCSFVKTGAFRPSAARIRVASFVGDGVSVPVLCMNCEDCPPMSVCPEKAIVREESSGKVVVQSEQCTGCKKCAPACPYLAINYEPESGLALLCDLCGGDPECVKYCFTEALRHDDQALPTLTGDYVEETRLSVLASRERPGTGSYHADDSQGQRQEGE